MLALIALVNTSEAFTATSAATSRVSVLDIPINEFSPSSPSPDTRSGFSTELQARKNDLSSEERGSDNVNSLIGIDRGMYLWAIVIALNLWFFSIPVEFRRTRICSEADTIAYPTKCMTSEQFRTGIADYYKNGGGIKFDFSIEGKE